MTFRDILKKYTYYLIISVLVVIALVFMPMLDTEGVLGVKMPNTALGMTQYIVIRCLVGVIVFLIFVSFNSQGKINVLDDPNYIEAYNLLNSVVDKEYVPMSPKRFLAQTYGIKAMTLAISMTATAFIMMEMILSYNYIILITYLLTIVMSIITGIFQMKKAEIYWTEEYLKYAKYIVRKMNKEEENKQC